MQRMLKTASVYYLAAHEEHLAKHDSPASFDSVKAAETVLAESWKQEFGEGNLPSTPLIQKLAGDVPKAAVRLLLKAHINAARVMASQSGLLSLVLPDPKFKAVVEAIESAGKQILEVEDLMRVAFERLDTRTEEERRLDLLRKLLGEIPQEVLDLIGEAEIELLGEFNKAGFLSDLQEIHVEVRDVEE